MFQDENSSQQEFRRCSDGHMRCEQEHIFVKRKLLIMKTKFENENGCECELHFVSENRKSEVIVYQKLILNHLKVLKSFKTKAVALLTDIRHSCAFYYRNGTVL